MIVCNVAACAMDNTILICSNCEVHWASVSRQHLLFCQR